jgi:DNA modification methylase
MSSIRTPPGVALVPLEALRPYERNARTHSADQIGQIAASMIEFGFTAPVLADEHGNVLAGHGRLEAARSLGMTAVPVVRVEGLTAAQRRAYILADNKIALNAGWDEALLAAELQDLERLEVDVSLTGFSSREIDELVNAALGLGEAEDEAEEAMPEPPTQPVTRPGDLWLLGEHRLLCGDSTDGTAVARLLNGEAPHLMVTDPPYGVDYDPNWRNEADRANGKAIGARATGQVTNDDRADWREAWALFPGEVAYVWHAGNKAHIVADSLLACDFELRAQIIWAKHRLVISRGHYHPQHEPCWYAVRGTGHWTGDRTQTTLWEIAHSKSDTGHGTQKPVECMRRPLLNNSERGDLVYDPFLGSGTTIIAAETTSRRVRGLELEPAYCDVIVQRWEQFTGGKARRATDG